MLIRFESEKISAELSVPTDGDVRKFLELHKSVSVRPGERHSVFPETIEEAKGLLVAFCESLERSEHPPEVVMRYVHNAFRAILAGGSRAFFDPSKAFGLTSSKRGRKPVKTRRDERIASEVEGLFAGGRSVLDAAMEIGEKYGLHEATIQKSIRRPGPTYPWRDPLPVEMSAQFTMP